jgi:ribosomal protein L3
MKRHGFSGQPASHGQSLMHRGMGSAGGSQGSGSRVLPGKRMPGNMGNESVTVKNLKVLQIDEKNGIVVVNGMFRTGVDVIGRRTDIKQDAYRVLRTRLSAYRMRSASRGRRVR